MTHHHHKSSAELEREIEARRMRIEERVDRITERLSPGQMLDEALRYTREGPVADFTRNLGRSVVDNPLPIAMLGASMAWLAVQSNMPRRDDHADRQALSSAYGEDYEEWDEMDDYDDYPVASIKGPWLQKVGVTGDGDGRYAEFIDDGGRKYRALTDEGGNRAGHFIDETGRMFRGFIDEAGHRVSDFRDEAGNRIARASGWASHSWKKAERGAKQMRRSVMKGAGRLGDRARDAGQGIRETGGQALGAADDFIHDRPLVSGAIAFALGALIAGALPRTRQEDRLFGEASDAVRDTAAQQASKLYDQGREQAADLHEKGRQAAADTYEEAKHAVQHGVEGAKTETGKVTHH